MTSLPGRSIPLAELSRFAGAAARTRRARVILALVLIALAGLAVAATLRQRTQTPPYLPEGASGIVVLDASASISSDTYNRIAATLGRLAGSGGRYGLVLFSDTAYQALPPGTRATELRTFERFFRVPSQSQPGLLPRPPQSPWTDSFAGGTRISAGLQLALDVIRRDKLGQPAVLLVSDLDDDQEDLESLTSVALAYRKLGIPLRVVGLDPAPEDERYVTRLLSRPGDLQRAALPGERGAMPTGAFPTAFVLLAVAVAVALAGFLVATERLRWRSSGEPA